MSTTGRYVMGSLIALAARTALAMFKRTTGLPKKGSPMTEMVRITKTFEVGADQMNLNDMRAIAAQKVEEWRLELISQGYTKVDPAIDVEVIPPPDLDPRYVTIEAILTAYKE